MRFSSPWRWASFGHESGLGRGPFTALLTARDGTHWAVALSGVYWYDNWLWQSVTKDLEALSVGAIRQVEARASSGVYVLGATRLFEGGPPGFRLVQGPANDPALRLISIAAAGDRLIVVGTRGDTTVFIEVSPDGTGKAIPAPADTRQLGAEPRLWRAGHDSALLTTSLGLYRWAHGSWTTAHRWSDPPVRVRTLAEDADGNGMLVAELDSRDGGYWEWSAPGAYRHRPSPGDSTIATLAAGPGVAVRMYVSGRVEVRRTGGPWSTTTHLPPSLQTARAADVDAAGDVWFGAIDTVGYYRSSSQRWTSLRQSEPSPLDRVNAILPRSSGEMWLGTEDGIVVVDTRNELRIVRHIPSVLGHRLGVITGLAEDGAGRAWVTSGSAFPGAYCLEAGAWRHYGAADGLTDAPIHDVAIDRSGRPWLLSLAERGSDAGAGAYVLRGATFERWSKQEGLPSDRVYAFAEGSDGTRWFGTSAGLSRWRNGQWTHWPSRPEVIDGITEARPMRVFTLALDANDRPWFGETRSASAFGLATIGADDRLQVIGAPAGPASLEIWRVTFDTDQTLWATTSEGLAARTNETWHFLSPQHGLGVSPWPVSAGPDGVYIGTTDGLFRLNRRALGGTPPRVVLDTVAAGAGDAFLQWRALAYRGNTAPSTIETRYQVDGGPWSAWSTERSVRISTLDPGAHPVRFEAKTPFVNTAVNAAMATIQVPWPLHQRVEVLVPTGLLGIGLLAAVSAWWRNRRLSEEERAIAESRLRASEERFTVLFRASPLPLLITSDVDGRIEQVNLAGELMAGSGGAGFKASVPFHKAISANEPERAAGSRVTVREVGFVTPDGRELTLLLHTSRIRLGEDLCRLTAITDITDLRHLEERLLSSQRMEAIGQISGGVAHEFNNLLTVVQGHADALASAPSVSAEALLRHVEAIRRSVSHAAQITGGLLTFARRQPLEGNVTDLNAAVIELTPMLEGLVGDAIRVDPRLDPAAAPISLDHTQIAQLLVNLSLNARDAMPDGGCLTMATRLVDGSLPADDKLLASRAGPWVSLIVSDTGCGMTEEVRRHVFEPFFTTKAPGLGTGLGLSICFGIVEHAGGRIEVASSPGDGTTVRLWLPAAVPVLPDSPGPLPQIQLAMQGRVVLLVEDETDVREIVAEVLEQAGYAVHACEGLEAIKTLLASGRMTPDLLLTDLVLPGGSGLEVAELVTQRYPHLPVLFMSGYSESVYSGLQPVTHLLPKPFTSPTLLRKVRELLDAGPN